MSTIIFIAAINFLVFLLGKTVGRMESELLGVHRMAALICVLRHVDNVCALKGQRLGDLSETELIHKVTEHLNLRRDE